MKINSYYPVLCVENLTETAAFYKDYLDFQVVFENEWYIHLQMKENSHVNLALMVYDHETIPEAMRKKSEGVLLNFEIEDVDRFYSKLKEKKVTMLQELRDEPWGQRHFITSDPSGIMIDVIKLIEPSEEYQKNYA